VTLRASPLIAADPERIAVGAVVVAPIVVFPAAHPPGGSPNAASSAHDQASQQPRLVFEVATAEAGVVLAGPLGRLEHVVIDDGGHGDRDPFLFRAKELATDPLSAGRGAGAGLGAVVVDPPNVGFVAQQSPEGGGVPESLAARRDRPVAGQADRDLTDGTAAGHVVIEDATDHGGLGFEDLKVRRPMRTLGHPPVAVGRLPGDDLAGPGSIQLAPSVALGDLRSFVLGDHTLDLGEQPGLGVVVDRGRVGEAHPHPQAGELVEDEDLVGIGAG